jgi:hypothetical protein
MLVNSFPPTGFIAQLRAICHLNYKMLSERPKVFLSFSTVFRKLRIEFEENKPELEDLYHLVQQIPLVMIELNTTLLHMMSNGNLTFTPACMPAGIHEILSQVH